MQVIPNACGFPQLETPMRRAARTTQFLRDIGPPISCSENKPDDSQDDSMRNRWPSASGTNGRLRRQMVIDEFEEFIGHP
jgi:hypothetical protein